jgi:hypothetical protein
LAFTREFYEDPAKRIQWQAFTRKNKLTDAPLSEIIAAVSTFLLPVLQAIQNGQAFTLRWTPGGPWTT